MRSDRVHPPDEKLLPKLSRRAEPIAKTAIEKAQKEVTNDKRLVELRHVMARRDSEIRQHRVAAAAGSSGSRGFGWGPWAQAQRAGDYAAEAWSRGKIQELQRRRAHAEAKFRQILKEKCWA